MRSADFWAGFIRVAAHGKNVFVAADTAAPSDRSRATRWRLLTAASVVLALLLTATWYAGRESAGLDAQTLSSELTGLAQKIASTQLQLQQQEAKTEQLEKELQNSGKAPAVALDSQLRRQLSQEQAAVNDYRAILQREQQSVTDNSRLLEALTNPGARLVSMKGQEAAADATAYVLLVEKSKLLFIGSKLPRLADGRQFQLWLVRKQEPKLVSAGVFTPDDSQRALMTFEEASLMTDISQLEVTDEPQGGSPEPTGAKLLETENSSSEKNAPSAN